MTAIHKKSRLNRATGWDAVTFIALTLIAIIIFLPFYSNFVLRSYPCTCAVPNGTAASPIIFM